MIPWRARFDTTLACQLPVPGLSARDWVGGLHSGAVVRPWPRRHSCIARPILRAPILHSGALAFAPTAAPLLADCEEPGWLVVVPGGRCVGAAARAGTRGSVHAHRAWVGGFPRQAGFGTPASAATPRPPFRKQDPGPIRQAAAANRRRNRCDTWQALTGFAAGRPTASVADSIA